MRVITCLRCKETVTLRTPKSPSAYCSLRCRFLEIVSKIKPNKNGFWIWPRSKNVQTGYGQVQAWDGTKRKIVTAHRLAYEYLVGPLGGKWVLHRCDVHACCNPQHLFLGMQLENMADMKAKGRGSDPQPRLKKAWETRRKTLTVS